MTLREKFEDGFKDSKENAKYCEKIADEFAIEFGNWLDKNQCDRFTDGRWLSSIINFHKSFTTEELLEMFKKEKELKNKFKK